MLFCEEKEPQLENKTCTTEEPPQGDDPDVAAYRKWMEERKQLRESLDRLHVDERWLKMKSNKTELERRVLDKMVQERRTAHAAECAATPQLKVCLRLVSVQLVRRKGKKL